MENTLIKRPVNLHQTYHVHVYFDKGSRDIAWDLCEKIRQEFELRIGQFHDEPIGPHPNDSCEIILGKKDFDAFIPWLENHRKDLTVFIRGMTGDDLLDHTEFAYWLGEPVQLDLSFFEFKETS